VLGFFLNTMLIFLIARCSKPHLGNYRQLLIIFACNDMFMVALHVIDSASTDTIFLAIFMFCIRLTSLQYVMLMSCTYFTVPFTLMNVNFLHRFLAVRRFFACFASATNNSVGKSLLRNMLPAESGISIGDGWIVLHYWVKKGRLHVLGLVTWLVVSAIISGNFIAASVMCALTVHRLKCAKTFSPGYKVHQFKLLRALFVQSVIPIFFVYLPFGVSACLPFVVAEREARLDHYYTVISSFPALDAVAIIVLMKDYRNGLVSIFRKKHGK
ncbi:hypothetical protein PENTCL1PPCAC_14309, partial [Pristionchus entomophagus]